MLVFGLERDGGVRDDGSGTVAGKGGHDGFFFLVGVDGARGLEVFGKRSVGIDGGTCDE